MKIEGIDHDQIEAADEASRDASQSADQLREHHGRVAAMTRVMHGMALPEADRATTIRGREQAETEAREMQGIATVLDNLYRQLGKAIERAEGREAIEQADDYRARVDKAVEGAEKIRAQYAEAQVAVQRELEAQAAARRAAGAKGKGNVGLSESLFERALAVAPEGVREIGRKWRRQTVLDS